MCTNHYPANRTKRIAFCGIDGCGKTSLISRLNAYYQNQGIATQIAKVDFRYKRICSNLLSDETNEKESTLIKRVVMAFDFVNYYTSISKCCDLLLCDRYDICYKILNKVDNLPQEIIACLDKVFASIVEPELYVYLDVSTETASSRLNARGNREKDENDATLALMRKFYYEEFQTKKNVLFLDAERSPEELFKITSSIIDKNIMGGRLS